MHQNSCLGRSARAAAVCGLLLWTAGSAAFAHDIWLTAGGTNERELAQVNFGDTDNRQMPDEERIISLRIISPGGETDLRTGLSAAKRLDQPVLVTRPFHAPAGSVLAVSYDNGFWVKIPGDSKQTNTSTLMVPKGTESHWTVKYGKTLLGPGSWRRVLHTRLELIALKDPFKLPAGGRLPVRLELDGRPLAGAKVVFGDGIQPIPDDRMPAMTTGSDGIVEIPLRRRGPYLITTDPEVPPAFPALARHDHLYASLAFDLSK